MRRAGVLQGRLSNGALSGRYMMITGSATVELGQVGPCLAPATRELLCIWTDRHSNGNGNGNGSGSGNGNGSVSMLFSRDRREFKGVWGSFPVFEFRRMEPRFRNERTGWNGTLQ